MERSAMRRAIVLSAFGLGTTSPNPPVGCVILDSHGWAVGEGYHVRKGEAHAEAQALHAAGERAHAGTAVVTIEPCSHHGRTPPCHEVIIDSGIRRVLVALRDPTGRGQGGVALLRHAGLSVVTDVLCDEARLVLDTWLTALYQERPFVTWVYAVPPDGLASGLSTVEESFLEAAVDVHNLRLVHDVVLTDDGEIYEGSPSGHKPEVFSLAMVHPRQEASQLLVALLRGGACSLLLDGSLPLASPFLAAGWVDQAVAYLAPSGSPSTVPPATAAGLIANFALQDVTRLGDIVRVRSRPAPSVTRARELPARDPLTGRWY
ncbi:MAG: bifunctional diaminohydroxyphosphoribosylaminopyrimidine deaminase/5-amino-6-(5-phosphoribosylamino)uracil reductase RibD [Pseudonocardiaceae bacterium]